MRCVVSVAPIRLLRTVPDDRLPARLSLRRPAAAVLNVRSCRCADTVSAGSPAVSHQCLEFRPRSPPLSAGWGGGGPEVALSQLESPPTLLSEARPIFGL
jgi:hypothetical protein